MIDTGTSNLHSVCSAFRKVGLEVETTLDKALLEAADIVVLPGVGAFEADIGALKRAGLDGFLRNRSLDQDRPLIGICLGLQLLADHSSEHGSHDGLGIIPGRVERLVSDDPAYRVPNIGWSPVRPSRESLLFPDPSIHPSFYFVHSYHLVCPDPETSVATIEFAGRNVIVAVEKGNTVAMQFHPEKSQDNGLDLLERLLAGFHAKGFAT